MTEFDLSTYASMTPAEFTALIKEAPKEQLEALMTGESRASILDAIFTRFPDQFRADRGATTTAVIHWHITGRADGGTDSYQVSIADGACTVSTELAADSKLAVTISGVDLLKLLSGAADPMMLFMTGKLKAKGDLALAANLANLFDLPKG